MTDTPLIHTSKGNLPVDSLTYTTSWGEDEQYIRFRETYTLNGEVVKQSCHVMAKQGLSVFPEQGTI